jgi:hypothetical protein
MTTEFTGNINIDKEKFDYCDGNTLIMDYLKKLEDTSDPVVSPSFDDFLKLPVNDGYKNNIKRVPNDFKSVKIEPPKTNSNDKVNE